MSTRSMGHSNKNDRLEPFFMKKDLTREQKFTKISVTLRNSYLPNATNTINSV